MGNKKFTLEATLLEDKVKGVENTDVTIKDNAGDRTMEIFIASRQITILLNRSDFYHYLSTRNART